MVKNDAISSLEGKVKKLRNEITERRLLGQAFDDLALQLAILREDIAVIRRDPYYFEFVRGRTRAYCTGGK